MSGKREKFGVIAVVVLMSLCLVAVAISIRVTKTLIEKKQQIVHNNTNAVKNINAEEGYKEIDAGNITDYLLNFNGKKVDFIKAFINSDRDILISFDALLEELGVEFSYFSSDDILLTQIANEQLIIKLGDTRFKYGDKEYELSFAPVAQKNHILVPLDLFDHLKGFGTNVSYLKGIAFLYYFPDYEASANSEPLFFTVNAEGSAQITDIYGKQLAVISEDKPYEKEGYSLDISCNGDTLALYINDKVYISDDEKKLYTVNIDTNAKLSYYGNYMYWIDKDAQRAYIYNIKTKETKELGDFYTKIDSGNNAVFDGSYYNVIYHYLDSADSSIIVLTNEKRSKYYAYVESNNKNLVASEVKISQDKKSMIFTTDKGSSVLDLNSFSVIDIGSTNTADWISNELILLKDEETISIIDKNGNNGGSLDETYDALGKASNSSGGIFYAGVSEIFYEEQGETFKLPYLNIDYDYFTGGSSQGPFIAVSTINNSIFLLKDNNRLRICSAKKLAMDIGKTDVISYYEKCISLSPDGMHYSILTNEFDMVTLLLVNNSTMNTTKLTLDISIGEVNKFNNVKFKWLSGSSMVVFNNHSAFIIEISDKIKINKAILPWKSELKNVITAG